MAAAQLEVPELWEVKDNQMFESGLGCLARFCFKIKFKKDSEYNLAQMP